MIAKTVKDLVKKEVQLTLENLEVGMTIPDLHGKDIEVNNDLICQMEAFEKSNPKSHAIWKNKITGTFLHFKYYEDHPAEKNKKKKPGRKPKKAKEIEVEDLEEIEQAVEVIEESLEQKIEAEAQSEEEMLLDDIEDYKVEYNVKTVNTKSQKFIRFFYKWKQSD